MYRNEAVAMNKINESEDTFDALLAKKEQYDRSYYQLELPLVSDDEYDALKGNLREYARNLGYDIPDDTLHYLDTNNAVTHPSRMYSLACAISTDKEKFRPLFKRKSHVIAEAKLDGVAINIIYLNDKLANAVTRGDHFKGESMLGKIARLENVPATESLHLDVYEVRGEVVISKKKLAELNAQRKTQGKPVYKTGRNAVAALLRSNDDEALAKAGCEFIVYGMGKGKEIFSDHKSMMGFLSELWTVTAALDELNWSDPIENTFNSVKEARDNYPYEIDGVVFKANCHKVQEELGYSGNDPKWAYALKFNEAVGTTRVEDVTISVGRTGAITGTLHYEPVELGGVTCTTAVIPSMEKLRIWSPYPGKEVQIMRAGDTIPYIVDMGRETHRDMFVVPRHCPSCNSELTIRGTETLICGNHSECKAQVLSLFHYQCSKKVLNFVGFGDKSRIKFIDALYDDGIKDMLGIWGLLAGPASARKPYFVKTGLTPGKIESIEESLSKLWRQPLWKLVAAAGFHGVAEGTCKKIASPYGGLMPLIADLEKGSLSGSPLTEKKMKSIRTNRPAMDWLYLVAGNFTLITDN